MATKKKAKASLTKVATRRDPRAPVRPTQAELKRTMAALSAIVGELEPPAEPHPGDLVDAMMHIQLAEGLECGYGVEGVRRIHAHNVDLNEFRVTEAYETEELLADLEMPDAFERCVTVQRAVGEVYNDQNSVNLVFLREAAVAERRSFFARLPSITPTVVRYLSNLVGFEEVLFSQRATQRVQVRLGIDPKSAAHSTFLEEVQSLFAPFGHVPLSLGRAAKPGELCLDPPLCPACLLVRLAPSTRR